MSSKTIGRHDVVVIGAGQSGLAAAYQLARRGIDFVVLEADERIGDVWRRRYDSLKLYSPAKLDALPGLPLPLPGHAFPTGGQMADYLEAYAAHHRLPVRTGVRVTHVARADDGGYEVTTADGRFPARRVIVATGPFQRPFVPDVAADLDPSIRQLHSSEYRNPGQLADGPVLVVGVSHSGADMAHEIALAGHRTILSGVDRGQLPIPLDSRRMRLLWPVMRFVATQVLTLSTPMGRRMMPKVRAHGGPLLRIRRPDLERAGIERHAARTTGVQAGKPMLADGTVLDVANVLWCTGFRPDFSWVEGQAPGEDGWPIQKRGVDESTPGLYFLGIPFLHAFASMLVLGAGRDAAHVVDHIAATTMPLSARAGRASKAIR